MKYIKPLGFFPLKEKMKERKMSFRQLEKETGIIFTHLNKLANERQAASPEIAKKIIDYFNREQCNTIKALTDKK